MIENSNELSESKHLPLHQNIATDSISINSIEPSVDRECSLSFETNEIISGSLLKEELHSLPSSVESNSSFVTAVNIQHNLINTTNTLQNEEKTLEKAYSPTSLTEDDTKRDQNDRSDEKKNVSPRPSQSQPQLQPPPPPPPPQQQQQQQQKQPQPQPQPQQPLDEKTADSTTLTTLFQSLYLRSPRYKSHWICFSQLHSSITLILICEPSLKVHFSFHSNFHFQFYMYLFFS
jgi:hypothetical protein